jgi:hypothetical protein
MPERTRYSCVPQLIFAGSLIRYSHQWAPKQVLAKIDQAFDSAPTGSGGKRFLLTKKAAEAALDSLLGITVEFTPDLDGHDPQAKIGVITGAEINGQDICRSGRGRDSDRGMRVHGAAILFPDKAAYQSTSLI